VISPVLLELVRCPDCLGGLVKTAGHSAPRCQGCGRLFEGATSDFLVLKPGAGFVETTKFLDESFHADGRDETVSPPLLSAGVRNAMLRRFLEMRAGDLVLDLGCGSGRFAVWSQESGAHVVGVDTGAFFAREARSGVDLVVGDLRRLSFADNTFSKAYAIDVFEHLSEEGLLATLREVARVLVPNGKLFVYTHLRQRSPFAPVLTAIGRTASFIERLGFSDLTIEKLRKTDHLNPLKGRRHLDAIADATGFQIDRFRYYTPLVSSIAAVGRRSPGHAAGEN
jgi:SAM-dependent methyltransferase